VNTGLFFKTCLYVVILPSYPSTIFKRRHAYFFLQGGRAERDLHSPVRNRTPYRFPGATFAISTAPTFLVTHSSPILTGDFLFPQLLTAPDQPLIFGSWCPPPFFSIDCVYTFPCPSRAPSPPLLTIGSCFRFTSVRGANEITMRRIRGITTASAKYPPQLQAHFLNRGTIRKMPRFSLVRNFRVWSLTF